MHVSHSQLTVFSRCGVKYWFQYVDPERERRPKGLWSPVGRAVHVTGRDMLAAKRDGLVLDHVALRASRAFDDALHGDEPIEEASVEAVRDARAEAMRLAELYQALVVPHVSPWKLEERLEIPLGDDLVFVAIIDVLEHLGDFEEAPLLRFRDTKTSNRQPDADQAATSLQLAIYGWAVAVALGVVPVAAVLDVLEKSRPPRYHLRTAPVDPGTWGSIERRIEALLRARETGLFAPASTDAWYCSSKHCEFWGVCPYALRPVTAGATSLHRIRAAPQLPSKPPAAP